jgi:5-keto 4-deoxyuronate isomerase
MALLELVPVVLALSVWAQLLQNKRILLRIDNSALVSIINKRTSKNKQIMKLIRPLVLLTMQYNIQLTALHIEGLHNEISDALSRFQMKRFRSLVTTAALYPMEIPQ